MGFITPSLQALACFDTVWALLLNFLNYFVWLRITDEVSVPEMSIWSILSIKAGIKWCIHLSRSLFLYILTVFYVCKELSISISFSQFPVFWHILKSPATIVCPCVTLILFLRILILLSDVLLLGYPTSCK